MNTIAEHDLRVVGRMLVERLGGQWSGQGGMCRCPAHDDRHPSLSIRVGETALLYHCFAGCAVADVLRAIGRLDRRALITINPRIPAPADGGARCLTRLQALWSEAVPVIGSPAERYLEKRGLLDVPAGQRFHARTPLRHGSDTCFRPALLAAVQEGAEIVALQRTFLDIERDRRARDLGRPRRILGRPGRGSVRLAPASEILGLAEGVESALSAMILLGLPVWAVLGAERLARVDIPLSVRRLVLLGDDDRAGRLGAAAALAAHAAEGRTVETLWPWHGLNDWNDVLRAEGEGVGIGSRHAA